MKILVVAYACHPYLGSELGVGWSAVCRLAREHVVCVITDDSNRAGWEQAAMAGGIPAGVRVRYLREGKPFVENRMLAHLQSWMRYRDFNSRVLEAAESWHREEQFALCHQVTIASWRMPSPLWRLPIPFIWGPIGGAGWIPPAFRPMLSRKARLFESLRDLNSRLAARGEAFRDCIRNSAVVLPANEETENFLKPFRGDKPMLRLPVAYLGDDVVARFRRGDDHEPGDDRGLRLFAGGNIEGRKGFVLALSALARVAARGINFRYTIAGGGPETGSLARLAAELGLQGKVVFHEGFQGDAFVRELQETDVYFLPSFRETMGITLVEAMLAGCYPVVADVSAQGEIVRAAGGTAVSADTPEGMIEGLADAILWCHGNREQMRAIARAAGAKVAGRFSAGSYDRTLREAQAIALAAGRGANP